MKCCNDLGVLAAIAVLALAALDLVALDLVALAALDLVVLVALGIPIESPSIVTQVLGPAFT